MCKRNRSIFFRERYFLPRASVVFGLHLGAEGARSQELGARSWKAGWIVDVRGFAVLIFMNVLFFRRSLIAIAVGAWCAATLAARAADAPCAPTELWVANTRAGGCEDPPKLSRCTESDGWRKATMKQWTALPADVPTCVWIPGNNNSDRDAKQQGRILLRRLARYAPKRGVRVLVWSWPSARTDAGPLQDLRIKAARSDSEGIRLSRFLNEWRPSGRVSFAGYSFGARIITGALNDLADAPRVQEGSGSAPDASLNAILMAPAMNNCWLLPGYRHGEAVSQVDELLIMKNPIDRALKWYPIMAYGRVHTGPQALGYTGLPGMSRLGEDAEKISHFNVSGIVGRRHDAYVYLSSSRIVERMVPYVFGDADDADGD